MHRRAFTVALAGLTCASLHAAEPKTAPPPVDAEFLEFLGSLDTEDEEWREYLASRPIRRETGKPAPKQAPESAPAPATKEKPVEVKKP